MKGWRGPAEKKGRPSLKKILNAPGAYVDEMLDGFVAAHPQYYAQPEPA